MARPTKYRQEFAERLPELMQNGESVVEVCAVLEINIDTFYAWTKRYPKFSEAYTRARALCQAWWERQGRQGLRLGKDFNDRLWDKNMRCRFPKDWMDSKIERQDEAVDLSEDQSLLAQLLAEEGSR